MIRTTTSQVLPLLCWLVSLNGVAIGADFYVATNGHDEWSGTLASPNAARTDGRSPLSSKLVTRSTKRRGGNKLFPGYTLQDGDATFLREKHKTQKSSIKHVNQIYDALDDLGRVAVP